MRHDPGMTLQPKLIVLALLTIASLSHAEPKKAAPAATKSGKPEEFVQKLYAEHAAMRGPMGGEKITEAGVAVWFSKGLTAQVWKDVQASKEEPGRLDFDVFYNSQDVQVSKLRVTDVKSDDFLASVTVTFRNYDKDESVRLNLRRIGGEKGEWRVCNIIYPEFDLLSHLVEPEEG